MITDEQRDFMRIGAFTYVEIASREDNAIMIDHLTNLVEVDYENKYGRIEDYGEWVKDFVVILADFEERNTFTAIEIETQNGISTAYYL